MLEMVFNGILEELLIATIGGILVMTYTKTIKRYKHKKLENKYPISGEYISTFDDIVDGVVVKTKAPVTLTQKGKKLQGETFFEKRKWLLEGEVTESGYVYGMYSAEARHDKGVGNFFLQFTNDGNLEGLWSGYDSINQQIVSGLYTFKKRPLIIVERVDKKNLSAILHISDLQLGQDYINPEEFLDEDLIKFQASVDNKIVGFITAKHLSIEDLYEKMPKLKNRKFKQFDVTQKIGYIGSVATSPNYENMGVASELFKFALKELLKTNNMVLMTGWKSKLGTNIESIAIKYGFEEIIELKEYWKEDSIKYNYTCPVCSNPCECSAVMYVKHN